METILSFPTTSRAAGCPSAILPKSVSAASVGAQQLSFILRHRPLSASGSALLLRPSPRGVTVFHLAPFPPAKRRSGLPPSPHRPPPTRRVRRPRLRTANAHCPKELPNDRAPSL